MYKVAIMMGSESDREVMSEARAYLDYVGIDYEIKILSAHRMPDATAEFAKSAEENGFCAIIAGAGMAAHLAGVVASHTLLPVIGVPRALENLEGMDSLLSIVQMPGGIPVATLAIGEPGAKNAGLLAAQILALSDEALAARLADFRARNTAGVAETVED